MRKNTLNKNIFIIAETACSHDGSLSRLKKLVKGASVAGADAVQFQIWKHENMVTPKHPNKQKLKPLELSELEWENIFKFTRKKQIKLCKKIFQLIESPEYINDNVSAYIANFLNPLISIILSILTRTVLSSRIVTSAIFDFSLINDPTFTGEINRTLSIP